MAVSSRSFVSCSEDGNLRLWNCDTNGPVLEGHKGTINCIAYPEAPLLPAFSPTQPRAHINPGHTNPMHQPLVHLWHHPFSGARAVCSTPGRP